MSWLKHYTKAQAELTERLSAITEPAPPASSIPERERLLAAWWDAQDHAHFPQWASRELADHAAAEAFDAYYDYMEMPR
jgi:hypothetical protein